MTIIQIHLDETAMARYRVLAAETGRSIPVLCQIAVEEAALQAFRTRKDDPAETTPVIISTTEKHHLLEATVGAITIPLKKLREVVDSGLSAYIPVRLTLREFKYYMNLHFRIHFKNLTDAQIDSLFQMVTKNNIEDFWANANNVL